ncbi:MAG: endonuclease domain-containing protein [Bacteroidota bacterium]|nr:endonuclease domain-containing protein [Bacteroidota bacterium]
MTTNFNIKTQTAKRRFLRAHLSKAEAIMWKNLSRKQMLGYKFRRQYGVDNYVIDFYCPELMLAIEIDGDTHYRNGAEEYDRQRQTHIEEFGIQFLRFTNTEVLKNLNGVLQSISNKISEIEAK